MVFWAKRQPIDKNRTIRNGFEMNQIVINVMTFSEEMEELTKIIPDQVGIVEIICK